MRLLGEVSMIHHVHERLLRAIRRPLALPRIAYMSNGSPFPGRANDEAVCLCKKRSKGAVRGGIPRGLEALLRSWERCSQFQNRNRQRAP